MYTAIDCELQQKKNLMGIFKESVSLAKRIRTNKLVGSSRRQVLKTYQIRLEVVHGENYVSKRSRALGDIINEHYKFDMKYQHAAGVPNPSASWNEDLRNTIATRTIINSVCG